MFDQGYVVVFFALVLTILTRLSGGGNKNKMPKVVESMKI